MIANMVVQGPGTLVTIIKENKKAKEIAYKWNADVIISDNRFGFRSDQTENIYLTHQLNIPSNNPIISNIASKIHHRIINKFDQCWVPDYKGSKNLAGKLSQVNIKTPTTYLGPLSRMKKEDRPIKYHFTAVLSGPEPQRSKLEDLILQAFSTTSTHKLCLVRGTNKESLTKPGKKNIEIFDFLTTKKLNEVLNASLHIICRSGYTSIMDLIKLEKSATLIPTPGQYEQEYLAKILDGKYCFSICHQKECPEALIKAINRVS
jgi:predicted glycosyltransferase